MPKHSGSMPSLNLLPIFTGFRCLGKMQRECQSTETVATWPLLGSKVDLCDCFECNSKHCLSSLIKVKQAVSPLQTRKKYSAAEDEPHAHVVNQKML